MAGQAISNDTFLSAAIRSLLLTTDFVVVVVQKQSGAGANHLCGRSVSRGQRKPSRGQFSSLQIGLREVLNHGRDAAMVVLVDRPPVSPATLQNLHDAFDAADPNIWAVVPEFSGKHGHPYLVDRGMIEAFVRVPPTSIARDVEHQNQEHIQYVPVDDPLVALNVNTPEDYAALLMRCS